jgi:hypothetical protein
MKLTPNFKTLPGWLTFSALLAAGAQAQDAGAGCSNATLDGWFGLGGSGLELAAPGDSAGSVIGVFQADGAGRITAFRLQEGVNTPPEFMGFFVLERDFLGEGGVARIDYTVGPDCRGIISWLDQIG